MNRRDLLRLLLASAAAECVDVERLLWVPRPIITVPTYRVDWNDWNLVQLYFRDGLQPRERISINEVSLLSGDDSRRALEAAEHVHPGLCRGWRDLLGGSPRRAPVPREYGPLSAITSGGVGYGLHVFQPPAGSPADVVLRHQRRAT